MVQGAEFGHRFPLWERRTAADIIITPVSLYEDAHSREALESNNKWEEARRDQKLTVFMGCSDARLMIPFGDTISARSIATAGAKQPYDTLVESDMVRQVVILAHHDGDTVMPGMRPSGCGGLGAKADAEMAKSERRIARFVKEHVQHPDVIIQAWISGLTIAERTGKPVLAATQDHITGIMYPLAAFINGGQEIKSGVSVRKLLEGQYNPAEIYANGLPVLNENSLQPDLRNILVENKIQVAEVNQKYPNLRHMAKVQRPRMVVFSTGIRSMKLRYPKTSEIPGTIFKLHVPRQVIGGTTYIPSDVLESSLDQAEYPIHYAAKNYGKPSEPFSTTDRFLIETNDIELSKHLAYRLLQEEWMREWAGLPDHHIIVAQIADGIPNIIEYYRPTT